MKDNYIKIENFDSKNIENNNQKNYIRKYAFIIISFIIMTLMIYLTIKLCIKIENKNESLYFNKDEENYHISQLIEDNNKSNYSFKATYEVNKYNENVDLINRKYKDNIVEMKINGENTFPCINFVFLNPGNYTIYYLLNIKELEKLDEMFKGIKKITSISFSKEFDTSNIKSLRSMFYNCPKLTSIDITNFATKNIVDIAYLFYGCSSLPSVDLHNFNSKSIKVMVSLFDGCSSLTSIDLSFFDTRYVTHINYLFKGCSSLTSVDLSNFNTENVIYMEHIFDGCSSLTSLDLSNFKTPNVKYMNYMFNKCFKLQYLDISNFSPNSRDAYSEFCSFINSIGTIKLRRELYDNVSKYIPKKWEIIFVEN
jgi:surface protein